MDLTKLTALLLRHEGLRLKPYIDTVGKLTVGVGHNLSDKGISKSIAMAMLSEDITDTLNFLNLKFDWFKNLDDVRARAIADLTFDLMGGLLDFHKMLEAIEVEDWDTAANELLDSKFAKQVPLRAKDLSYMIRTGKDL
jgi:lysozyme